MNKLWVNCGEVRQFSKIRSNAKLTARTKNRKRKELTLSSEDHGDARLIISYFNDSEKINQEPDCAKCGWKVLYGEELIRTTNNNMDPKHYHVWCKKPRTGEVIKRSD